MHEVSLEQIPDEALLSTVRRLTAHSNVALAELLAHLGEVELRGIHRTRACASLYTYCVYELRMSEDAAFRRAKAARLVRRHDDVRDAVAKGEIHLTGLLMIAPFLGAERHVEVLRRARFRSKRELLRLVAELDPRPPVVARIEPLGPAPARRATRAAYAESLEGPVRELRHGERPEDWFAEGAAATEPHAAPSAPARELRDAIAAPAWAPHDARPPIALEPHAGGDAQSASVQEPRDANDACPASVVAPDPAASRPLHYKVQLTASQRYVDLMDEAVALLGHERPRPDLAEVQLRALDLLVVKLRKERRGEVGAKGGATMKRVLAGGTRAPAPARVVQTPRGGQTGSRHVPRSVRRTVWERDGARCVFVDERGVRCRETSRLELHHRAPHALGGPNTADNLELRCTAHNALAAELDFGRDHIDRMRPLRVQ